MKPVHFPLVNGWLRGTGTVGDLPVFRGHDVIVSCWRMSWLDRLRALATGRVWLVVLAATTHAPVNLRTDDPIEKVGA